MMMVAIKPIRLNVVTPNVVMLVVVAPFRRHFSAEEI